MTAKQKDWAIFLPALSTFYATYIGKQRYGNYVDPARIPADYENGIEGMNWLNADQAYFPYKWSLYSAGHANLDVNKFDEKEDMVRNRDRKNTFILGDSGGFQIGKGVWEGDWKDPNCPKAAKKRRQVLEWMDAYADRGMILDIPTWITKIPTSAAATGINSYADAVTATNINNNYFMQNRNGNCKFLNVLQGENHADADKWYDTMKHYCDPTKHAQPFEGWAMGGQNMCDIHLILRRLVALRFDGLLEKGRHDWMHFLGTSRLEWALLLTDIQRAVRKYHNENFTVSFDCASPFLATANGQVYYETALPDRAKWSYRMQASVDNKKYATDTRRFGVGVVQDKHFKVFEDSPISERTLMKDVCIYAPGDLNKIGKEGRTSWDSFSYAIQMGHNVWTHIYAVQEANRRYEQGQSPAALVREVFDRETFTGIVDEIFATSDRDKAEQIIEHHNKFWLQIIGGRGLSGKKAVNASTMFDVFFEQKEPTQEYHIDDSGLDEGNLDKLELEVENV